MSLTSVRGLLQVMRRRLPVFLIVLLAVAAALFSTYQVNPVEYRSELRFIVAQEPLESTLQAEEERYFNWVASEYIVFGISDWANGTSFAEQVSAEVQAQGFADWDTDRVDAALETGATRSRLVLAVRDTDEEMVERLSFIAAQMLLAQEGLEIPQLQRDGAEIVPIDTELFIEELEQDVSPLAQILPRLATALAIALVIALLIELIDPTIRSAETLDWLDLPVLGEIPTE